MQYRSRLLLVLLVAYIDLIGFQNAELIAEFRMEMSEANKIKIKRVLKSLSRIYRLVEFGFRSWLLELQDK